MVIFLASLLSFFLRAFSSKGAILSENAVLKKENEILLRRAGKKRARFSFYDRLFLVVLNRAADIKHHLTLVKPETVLAWQRTLIRRFWTFEHRPARRGRKPVDTEVKNLILSMKNDNVLWGVKRIQGELLKHDISLSTKTIRKILQSFRRQGKIRRSLTWKKFLETQIQSIYAMDFLTVDTILSDRIRGFSNRSRNLVKQIERPVPSARLPCSVGYPTTIRDRRHDVRNKSPLRVEVNTARKIRTLTLHLVNSRVSSLIHQHTDFAAEQVADTHPRNGWGPIHHPQRVCRSPSMSKTSAVDRTGNG